MSDRFDGVQTLKIPFIHTDVSQLEDMTVHK